MALSLTWLILVQARTSPLLNTTLRWFLCAMILANVASQMVFALLAVYLSELGADVAQIGLVFSVASLVPLVLQIVGGWLSDSIGRLRTIAIGSVIACFGFLGLVLAPSWQWVMVALCLEFVSGSLVGPSFGAFIADQSTEENRGRVFGLSKGIFMIVSVVGPPLGGFLAQHYGFRTMLLAAFVTYASAAVLRVWMARAVRFAGGVATERLTWRSFRGKMGHMVGMLTGGGILTWILITDGVRDVAFRLSGELQPIFLSEVGGMSVQQIGWLRSVFGASIMLTTLAAGWLADKRSERVAIVGGFFLQFVALVVFVQSTGFVGFAVAALTFGVGVGVMMPAYDSLVSKVVPEKMRGVAFGLFHTSLGLVSLPAPWVGGQMWKRFGPKVPFSVTAVAALLSIVPAWSKFVLRDKGQAKAKAVGRREG